MWRGSVGDRGPEPRSNIPHQVPEISVADPVSALAPQESVERTAGFKQSEMFDLARPPIVQRTQFRRVDRGSQTDFGHPGFES